MSFLVAFLWANLIVLGCFMGGYGALITGMTTIIVLVSNFIFTRRQGVASHRLLKKVIFVLNLFFVLSVAIFDYIIFPVLSICFAILFGLLVAQYKKYSEWTIRPFLSHFTFSIVLAVVLIGAYSKIFSLGDAFRDSMLIGMTLTNGINTLFILRSHQRPLYLQVLSTFFLLILCCALVYVISTGSNALPYAARAGNNTLVKVLLKAGYGVNTKGKDSQSPLIEATGNWNTEVMTTLLNAGADPNIKDTYNGYTALITASTHGYRDSVQILLKAGADPNKNDDGGFTPLMQAQDSYIKEMLIAAGAKS